MGKRTHATGCAPLQICADTTAGANASRKVAAHRKVPTRVPFLFPSACGSLGRRRRKRQTCARGQTSLRSPRPRGEPSDVTGRGLRKAPPLTLLLPGARTANQHPAPAPAGLWTRHGNFLLFGEYTVQCSMSVSAAAQRNSHFVTKLDLHQDARGSKSCSVP